jgi:hypothetical protein
LPAVVKHVLILGALLAAPASAEEEFDPLTVDVVDAINCHIDAPTFNGFAASLDEADQLKKRGWRKLPGKNAFMYEYLLPKPINVTGAYTTRHVALSAGAMMAVLALPDPSALAKEEQIENAADPAELIEGLVKEGSLTPEQAKQIPRTNKFMGERVIVDVKERDEELKADFHTTIRRSISNVSTHPGKTLYGCAYKIDMKLDSEK